MAIVCKGLVDPLSATWQLSSPLCAACAAHRRADYKYPGQTRQRVQKSRMPAAHQHQMIERRARRRRSSIKSSSAREAARMSGTDVSHDAEMKGARVEPAVLLHEKPVMQVQGVSDLQKHEFLFQVPRDHSNPNHEATFTIHADIIRKKNHADSGKTLADFAPMRTFVYLCGGPGCAQEEQRHRELTDYVVSNGYQLLLLDYRGTGGSEKLDLDRALAIRQSSGEDGLLRAFQETRQGNIVRDLEAVRLYLNALYKSNDKFVLMGQSFGGWIAMLYVQRYPASVDGCVLTAGMPPIGTSVRDVYESLFRSVLENNQRFYSEPSIRSGKKEDPSAIVERIAKAILERPGEDDEGNRLSLTTFASMGRRLGSPAGAEDMYKRLVAIDEALAKSRGPAARVKFTNGDGKRVSVFAAIDAHEFNRRILYGVEHEMQCYADKKGQVKPWCASELRKRCERDRHFEWTTARTLQELEKCPRPFHFLGEGFMPEHADDYVTLRKLGGRAFVEKMAKAGQTEDTWNEKLLGKNEVPIYSVFFEADMFVDAKLSERAAKVVGAVAPIKVNNKSHMLHSAVRANCEQLVNLIKNESKCPYFQKPRTITNKATSKKA